MRFGTFVPQGWRLDLVGIAPEDHWSTMLGVAHAAERFGFESVWVFDHFHTVPEATQEPTYEAWSVMAALAAATDTVRLGQMCTCNGYRSPAYLAKVAASIDQISGGRVEMGIGGGWYEAEYLAYGYPFPRPSVRLGELDEAVQIMQKMWTEPEASFSGKHYTIDGAICQPKPAQGSIPMWVAGGGEQLTLRTAAKYADYTNFSSVPETFKHKSDVLAKHCADVGTDFDAIVRSANFGVVIAETESGVEAQMDMLGEKYGRVLDDGRKAIERYFVGPHACVGTPEQIVEKIAAVAELGMTYAITYFPDMAYTQDSMELFATQVMPHIA